MKSLILLLAVEMAVSFAFAGNGAKSEGKTKIDRIPASASSEQFCKENPSQCKEFAYPTMSFGDSKIKYKIAYQSEYGSHNPNPGFLTSFCIAQGFKNFSAAMTEAVDRQKERDTLFFAPGYSGIDNGAFYEGGLTNYIFSKIVCSPK